MKEPLVFLLANSLRLAAGAASARAFLRALR